MQKHSESIDDGDLLSKLNINQDLDMVQIIGGLQCIINTCLDINIKYDGDNMGEDQVVDEDIQGKKVVKE